MLRILQQKTLKREFAVVLMAWLISLSTWAALTGGTPQALQVIDMFILPIGMIFAGAFGLDWISKSTNIAGPPTAPPEN